MARKLTPQEYELLKEIREQTKAPYCSIIAGIKKCGLDKESVINYLREIAIVYAHKNSVDKCLVTKASDSDHMDTFS